MPALPASVLAVLESDRQRQRVVPARAGNAGRMEIDTDHAVSDVRTLNVRVEAR